MSISLTEDVKTLAELEAGAREIVKQIHKTGRPVATFERKLKTANLARLLMQAEADVQAGRTKPARSVLKEFRRGVEM